MNQKSASESPIRSETLRTVLSTMLGTPVIQADYQIEELDDGTVGDVRLVTGMAETANGSKSAYSVVLKIQEKWERFGDRQSWRREYDLYTSNLGSEFSDSFRWPRCYHAEMNEQENETQIWLEYINGITGLDLTGEMYERAAEKLGRFQGKLYSQKPGVLENLTNLSSVDFLKKHYARYTTGNAVYDYIRSDDCEIPGHLREMLINIDENSDEIWGQIEELPIVLCHRDFWVANIICSGEKVFIIDWDTTGWGYMGEDIASLIADEADVDNMVEYYCKCVPAYYRGFSEYVDVTHISDNGIFELILVMFGYRLAEWYKSAECPEEKSVQLNTLQKIYEMRPQNR